MRLIVLFLLLCSFHAHSQHYFPVYGDSVSWNVLECHWGKCSTSTYQYVGDTNLCGESYSRVNFNLMANDTLVLDQIVTFIRVDSMKVYYRYINYSGHFAGCQIPEGVLYDFSLQIKDTFEIEFIDFSNGKSVYVVDSIWQEIHQGINRQVMSMKYVSGFWAYDQHWIEGIGSDVHPLYYISTNHSGSENEWSLSCVDSASVPIFRRPDNRPCDLSWVGVDEQQENQQLTIYPNPANNVVNIDSDKDIQQIEIFGPNGQRISATGNMSIDISEHSEGLYFIQLEFKDGSTVRKKLIILHQ